MSKTHTLTHTLSGVICASKIRYVYSVCMYDECPQSILLVAAVRLWTRVPSGMGFFFGTGTRPTSPPTRTSVRTWAAAVVAFSTLFVTRTHRRVYISIYGILYMYSQTCATFALMRAGYKMRGRGSGSSYVRTLRRKWVLSLVVEGYRLQGRIRDEKEEVSRT